MNYFLEKKISQQINKIGVNICESKHEMGCGVE